jgi:hypothetical protein
LASEILSFLLNNLQLNNSQLKIQRDCAQTLPTCKQGALCAPWGVLGETLVAKAGNHKLKIHSPKQAKIAIFGTVGLKNCVLKPCHAA